MPRACIIYEGKHGFTETVIKKMAPILGPARYFPLAEYKNELRDKYDFFVIGGPVDNEKIDQSILDFVSANASWLSGKRVALFATCPSEVNGREQLEPLMKILGNSVVSAEVVHGDADHLDLPELVEYALRVKALINKGYVPMPAEQLKTYIEGFLKSYRYCTLCTGSGTRVRGTTINYTYRDGYIYAGCEGSGKFANLLLNNNVCISLFGPYPGYGREGPAENQVGLQLFGTATILDLASDEFKKMVEELVGDYNMIASLPFLLHRLSIKLDKAVIFWAQLAKMGYGNKQTYIF